MKLQFFSKFHLIDYVTTYCASFIRTQLKNKCLQCLKLPVQNNNEYFINLVFIIFYMLITIKLGAVIIYYNRYKKVKKNKFSSI